MQTSIKPYPKKKDFKLKEEFSKIVNYINKTQNKQINKKYKLSYIIKKCVLDNYSEYDNKTHEACVHKLYNHYQKKFTETGKQEYNIKIFDLDNNDDNSLVQFIVDNTPKAGEQPKGIVFFASQNNKHAISAFIKHDNKIFIQSLSLHDYALGYRLEQILDEKNINPKVIHLKNWGMDDDDCPQKAESGCIIFAFKYTKLLCADNYKLFNDIKPSTVEYNVEILPPDLLKYAQSETVVKKALENYKAIFELSDEKQKEITDYRKNHFGKFRILYHQLKYFPKPD